MPPNRGIMKKLVPREEIYDIYWYFAHERNEIFYRKAAGDPQPWTEDPILQQYKFTNTYRVNDRVSQFLVKNVIYNGKEYKPEDVIFRILLFKIFNIESTWLELEKEFGDITLDNFDLHAYADHLHKVAYKKAVENNAYMMKPPTGAYLSKHKNYMALLERLFKKKNLADKILQAKDLQQGFEVLNKVEGFGNFLAYQYATDINYSDVVDWQEYDFTIPGVGAKRGIEKVFKEFDKDHMEEAVWWMYDHQEEEFAKRGYKFRKLGNKRKMQPIDCQNVFCETDKYCRVAHPELVTACSEIKNTYGGKRPPIEFFYPPKWKL